MQVVSAVPLSCYGIKRLSGAKVSSGRKVSLPNVMLVGSSGWSDLVVV